MSDRLKDLQRQRALAQEQLAWLDREIARETGQAPATPPAASVQPAAIPSEIETARIAEEILAQYQKPGQTSVGDAKRGCYIYFFVALAALGIFAVGAYFLYLRLRG